MSFDPSMMFAKRMDFAVVFGWQQGWRMLCAIKCNHPPAEKQEHDMVHQRKPNVP
jgi:hypothetical protein